MDLSVTSPSIPEAVWLDLLGSDRFALARLIARETGAALKKAGADHVHAPLVLRDATADWLVLMSGALLVASWTGRLEGRHVAVAVASRHRGEAEPPAFPAPRAARADPVYAYRHVVGFGDTNLVG